MRYLIQFADKTFKRVSEQEGKAALVSWAAGRPVVLRGAGFAHHMISSIKPISKNWFDKQTAEDVPQLEAPARMDYLEKSNAKLLGFSDKKELLEAPPWTKAGLLTRLSK